MGITRIWGRGMYEHIQAAEISPEESLGRLLVQVLALGMTVGIGLNIAFAVWISIRLGRIEKCVKDRSKR